MATESYQAQLERVQAAIAKIESGGQDVDYEGKHVRFGDLETLYARESRLRVLAAREAGTGGRVIYVEPRDA